METMTQVLAPVTHLIPPQALPAELNLGEPPELALADVYFTGYELFSVGEGLAFALTIVIARELSLEIPGLAGAKLVVGAPPGGDVTTFRLTAFLTEDGFELRADDIRIALRLPPSILTPVPAGDGGTAPPYAEIAVHGSILVDHHLDIRVQGFDRLSLAPVMVGSSGVVISASDVVLSLS